MRFVYAMLSIRDRLRARRIDNANKHEFGPNAPLYGERIWVAPGDVRLVVLNGPRRRESGRVKDGDWDLKAEPVESDPKIAYCLRHFRDGQDWYSSGAIAHMEALISKNGSADGCKTRKDIDRRFTELDRINEIATATGELMPSANARPGTFRECGGVLIHIGRDGQPLFGLGGHHRLGIALAQRLDLIPAQLGSIHPGGLAALATFRAKPKPAARTE